MNLSNPTITATQSGDRWTLTASVTENFSREEINANFQFEDFVTFWEWDTSDHDFLTNTRTERLASPPASIAARISGRTVVPVLP